jgi:DNA-binding LytR/AlgR family response regulator
MSLSVLLADDEPIARRRLALMLREMDDVTVAGEAENGLEAVERTRKCRPDIVLLDINMPGLDGFDTVSLLGGAGGPIIIFVTAFAQHALRAWGHDVGGYLLKPVGFEALRAALDRAAATLRTQAAARRVHDMAARIAAIEDADPASEAFATEFWVSGTRRRTRVPVDDIRFIVAERDYVRLHVGDGEHLMRASIAALTAKLNPDDFVRIHRSVVVRRSEIAAVEQTAHGAMRLRLRGSTTHPVGRTYASKVRTLVRPRQD